jgi:hypothetical protein
MIDRRAFMLALAPLLAAGPALAHHGWRWAADGNFELTGVIKSARLGMPHGMLEVDVNGEMWTVEAGQPWRHERVGLDEALLKAGTEITVSGARSADENQKLVKAERITIAGKMYNLYPGRS